MTHIRVDRVQRRGERPGKHRQSSANCEDHHVDAPCIQAEQIHHLGFFRRGADRRSDARAFNGKEHRGGDSKTGDKDRKTIGGVGEIAHHRNCDVERRRDRHGMPRRRAV